VAAAPYAEKKREAFPEYVCAGRAYAGAFIFSNEI
jgi:hypothetical protein